jgi:hypothetical protein
MRYWRVSAATQMIKIIKLNYVCFSTYVPQSLVGAYLLTQLIAVCKSLKMNSIKSDLILNYTALPKVPLISGHLFAGDDMRL